MFSASSITGVLVQKRNGEVLDVGDYTITIRLTDKADVGQEPLTNYESLLVIVCR